MVATPELDDPNFDGTVVLLLEHGPGGALGVVLNRPSPLAVAEAMASGPSPDTTTAWSEVTSPPHVVFVGGPVQPNAVIALARVHEVSDGDRFEPLFADVGVVNLGDGPLPDVGTLLDLRVFAGYAGWEEGQLEGEVQAGAWFVVEAEVGDAFGAEAEALWRQVLQRQGGLFTTVTDNPALN